VETPECASNKSLSPSAAANPGANTLPQNACKTAIKAAPPPTAKTSPYDYVATVIYYPESVPYWDKDCTNPSCYGVPLYRQYLTGKESDKTLEWAHWYKNQCNLPANISTPQCRWPMIRMAGEALGTRETLTPNRGKFYLDTTVPLEMQKDIKDNNKPPNIIAHGEPYNTQGGPGISVDNFGNVFRPGETYNVFFVYAKKSTSQTYQIYVGKGDPNGGSVKAIRVKIPGSIDPIPYEGGNSPSWLTVDTSTVATDGIVSVTVNFAGLTELDPTPANGLCQPRKFCSSDGTTTCANGLADTDPAVKISAKLKDNADRACKIWAVKDLDCPTKGCLGFSFTLPSATYFTADATLTSPSPHRPAPDNFPPNDKNKTNIPEWLIKFVGSTFAPDNQTGGQCNYPTLPTIPPIGSGECATPDWVPQ
jgi:hypothetical protein